MADEAARPAAEGDDDAPEEDETAAAARSGQSGQATRDLDRVSSRGTLAGEERDEFDAAKLTKAVSDMAERIQRDKDARKRKEEELSRIAVTEADVALVMNELDLSKAAAERKLRMHANNVAALLREAVNA